MIIVAIQRSRIWDLPLMFLVVLGVLVAAPAVFCATWSSDLMAWDFSGHWWVKALTFQFASRGYIQSLRPVGYILSRYSLDYFDNSLESLLWTSFDRTVFRIKNLRMILETGTADRGLLRGPSDSADWGGGKNGHRSNVHSLIRFHLIDAESSIYIYMIIYA